MKIRKTFIFTFLLLALVLSACVPVNSEEAVMEKPTEVMMEKPTDDMMEKPTDAMMEKPTEAMMEETKVSDMSMETPAVDTMDKPVDGEMMATPDWFSTELTDVNTGSTFTINDFKGKVILVETMAQWCPSCKRQQTEVKSLIEKLGMTDDLVVIALDTDPNEDQESLKTYASSNGFEWVYAVAPAEVSREISNLYGVQFINPPSTPILIIDRKGEAHPLPFGIKSADDLLKSIESFLEEM